MRPEELFVVVCASVADSQHPASLQQGPVKYLLDLPGVKRRCVHLHSQQGLSDGPVQLLILFRAFGMQKLGTCAESNMPKAWPMTSQAHACRQENHHLVQGAIGGGHEEVVVIIVVILQASICSTARLTAPAHDVTKTCTIRSNIPRGLC